MFAMPFGPLLAWKRGDLLGVAQRLMAAFARRACRHCRRLSRSKAAHRCWRRSASALRFFVMAGAVIDLAERTGLFRVPLAGGARARRRTAALGLGHGVRAFRHRHHAARHHRRAQLGHASASSRSSRAQTISLSGYELSFDGTRCSGRARTTREVAANFTVRQRRRAIGTMEPSKRTFASRGRPRPTKRR